MFFKQDFTNDQPRWIDLPLYQEQYSAEEAGEDGIAEEIEKYTDEVDRDWTIKLPRDIEEVNLISVVLGPI